ncbi:hypothetical protein CCACVL1_00014, partial [Corchorus capsularis]
MDKKAFALRHPNPQLPSSRLQETTLFYRTVQSYRRHPLGPIRHRQCDPKPNPNWS